MGYEGTNEISQDVPEITRTVLSVVEFLDPEDETVTGGSLYNFAILNSLETGHLGKPLISPNW